MELLLNSTLENKVNHCLSSDAVAVAEVHLAYSAAEISQITATFTRIHDIFMEISTELPFL